jgi:hypothetical protein
LKLNVIQAVSMVAWNRPVSLSFSSTQAQQRKHSMTAANNASKQTISAMFDRESDAEEAAEEIIKSGIPRSSVTLTPGHRGRAPAEDTSGFIDAVANFFFTDEQRSIYAEGLRRGGFLVTAQAESPFQYDAALKILSEKGSIDIDERAEQWRSEGWVA